jgi:hypothetical protein
MSLQDINIKIFSNYSDDTTHLDTKDRMQADGYHNIVDYINEYSDKERGEFISLLLEQFLNDRSFETKKGAQYWHEVLASLRDEIKANIYSATIRIAVNVDVVSDKEYETEQEFIDSIYEEDVYDLIRNNGYQVTVEHNDAEIMDIDDVCTVD